MLTSTSQPYISDHPLGAKTTWVAFPVLFRVTEESFSAALQIAQDVCTELHSLGEELTTERIEVGSIPVADEAAPETTAQFIRSGKETIAEIYTCLFARFDASIPFWEKLSSVTKAMDSIATFVEDKRPRKNVKIEVGIQFKGK